MVFWNMQICQGYRHFKGTCFLHLQYHRLKLKSPNRGHEMVLFFASINKFKPLFPVLQCFLKFCYTNIWNLGQETKLQSLYLDRTMEKRFNINYYSKWWPRRLHKCESMLMFRFFLMNISHNISTLPKFAHWALYMNILQNYEGSDNGEVFLYS